MDKTNTTIGIALLLGALGLFFYTSKQQTEYQKAQQEYAQQIAEQNRAEEAKRAAEVAPEVPALVNAGAPAASAVSVATKSAATAALLPEQIVEAILPEQTVSLENNYIVVTLTTKGGAIRHVALKKYEAVQDKPEPYLLNEGAPVGILAFSTVGPKSTPGAYEADYRIAEQSATSVTFARTNPVNGMEIRRTYSIDMEEAGPSPYLITHVTRYINHADKAEGVGSVYLNIGSAAPTTADPRGMNLTAGYYDGNDAHFTAATTFAASNGFLGIGRRDATDRNTIPSSTVWAAVKNQFFVGIATPKEAAVAFHIEPLKLPPATVGGITKDGITAQMQFDVGFVPASKEKRLEISYYAGPKELSRIDKLPQNQDMVMQFPSGIWGWVGFISKSLLYFLKAIYAVVHNWGFAIILITIIIRLLLWPLTAKATKMSKKMAALSKPMAEINERYKAKLENPSLKADEKAKLTAKKQKELMDLFKDNKVNPAAGCIPMMAQLPIFFAFYQMLQSASELRFQDFLWIHDLSLPDTVFHLWVIPINPISILMGVSMYYQMRMTPSPSTDEFQQKLMRMMPLVFLVICYNFASGLVLYWTISNSISILQQFITNRHKDEPESTPAPPVTPTKGKFKAKKYV
ncbi:MAG: membrane protein insertase YidC [Verrucomicrobiota bacterium]|nr:membrane protein insertase YidC [Verrucomicrobiota bacterium]